jgi:predicted RNA-binding protein with PIN domain
VLLVDAHNVLHAAHGNSEEMSWLVDRLASLAALEDMQVEVVADTLSPLTASLPQVSIVGSDPAAGGADPVLARRARELAQAGHRVLLATDDHALRDAVSGWCDQIWPSATLVQMAIEAHSRAVLQSDAHAAHSSNPQPEGEGGTSRLDGRIDPDVLAALERIRRGESGT